jgi:hypothetical protein
MDSVEELKAEIDRLRRLFRMHHMEMPEHIISHPHRYQGCRWFGCDKEGTPEDVLEFCVECEGVYDCEGTFAALWGLDK